MDSPPDGGTSTSNTKSLLTTIPLLMMLLVSCKRVPGNSSGPGAGANGQSLEGLTESLKLKPGMQIHLKQSTLAWGDQWIPLAPGQSVQRTLTIVNPSSAEGLSFTWSLQVPGSHPDGATSPESAPQASGTPRGTPQVQIKGWEGKMTLANAMGSRRLTLPAFWPDGELYLSNASAIWLSDRAYEELKKSRQTEWGSGILDNPLLGPLQGLELLEKNLDKVQAQTDQTPEQEKAANEIVVDKKTARYSLKINGVPREVEVIEAGNALAAYKILNNAQNPLIVEVDFLPKADVGQLMFSPLALLKGLLEYQVTEIDLAKEKK